MLSSVNQNALDSWSKHNGQGVGWVSTDILSKCQPIVVTDGLPGWRTWPPMSYRVSVDLTECQRTLRNCMAFEKWCSLLCTSVWRSFFVSQLWKLLLFAFFICCSQACRQAWYIKWNIISYVQPRQAVILFNPSFPSLLLYLKNFSQLFRCFFNYSKPSFRCKLNSQFLLQSFMWTASQLLTSCFFATHWVLFSLLASSLPFASHL